MQDQYFNGYQILNNLGNLNDNILENNEKLLAGMLKSHKRICVIRFDLKFPVGFDFNLRDRCISRFIDSLKGRIGNDLRMRTKQRKRKVHSEVGYCWVKELSGRDHWHYHFALMVNRDVYNYLGKINSDNNNMYQRVLNAWASALSLVPNQCQGLVHIPKNPIYAIDLNSPFYEAQVQDVLQRLSYFAKYETKPYGLGTNSRFYGTSQVKC